MTWYITSVLYIDLNSLPENIQFQVSKQRYKNSETINYWSELSPSGNDWNENCNLQSLNEYYEDQKVNFNGSFTEFIEKYNLLLDKYIIDQNIPLKDVTDIIINCS